MPIKYRRRVTRQPAIDLPAPSGSRRKQMLARLLSRHTCSFPRSSERAGDPIGRDRVGRVWIALIGDRHTPAYATERNDVPLFVRLKEPPHQLNILLRHSPRSIPQAAPRRARQVMLWWKGTLSARALLSAESKTSRPPGRDAWIGRHGRGAADDAITPAWRRVSERDRADCAIVAKRQPGTRPSGRSLSAEGRTTTDARDGRAMVGCGIGCKRRPVLL